jgi:hypothetical protein
MMSDIPKWDETEDVAPVAADVPKFEDTSEPSFEDTTEVESPSPIIDKISHANNTAQNVITGGSAGALTGLAAKELIERGGRGLINVAGDLDASQIDKIGANADLYKKASPLEGILEEYRTLGAQNKQTGIDAAAEARKALEGHPNIPVNEYYNTLAQPAKNPKLSLDLAPGKPEELLTSRMDEVAPSVNAEKEKLMSIDSELGDVDKNLANPPVDERLAINQAHKDAKFQNKLENSAPIAKPDRADQIVGAGDDFKAKKETRQLQRIDERIAKVEHRMSKAEIPGLYKDQLENIQKRKEDFIYNQTNQKEKASTVRGANDAKSLEVAENRKAQMTFNKILDDEKTAQLKALKQREKYEKLLEQKKKLEADKTKAQLKIEEKVSGAKAAADADLDKVRKTPAQIRATDPAYFDNKILGESYADSLGKAVDKVKDAKDISPQRMDQLIQELRESDVNYDASGAVNNFNKDLSKSVSDDLKNRVPGYKTGMSKAEKTFETEALFDKLGIKYNKDLGRVTLEDSGRQRLNRILLDPERYKEEHGYLKQALGDVGQSNVDDLLKGHEMSALKSEVGRLRSGKMLNTHDINAAVTGNMQNIPGTIGKMGGTKMQELYALAKETRPMKAFKGLVHNAPGILGAAGALMGAASAANAGELSPAEAAVAGTAEAVNPLPFTDAVAGSC